MYLDRTYRPRRRRRGGAGRFWPLYLLIALGIILYEQQPSWLVTPQFQPTPSPTRSAVAFLADAAQALAERDYAAAIAIYNQVARLEPSNPEPLIAQSKLYLMLGDLPASHTAAERAVEIAPEDPAALNALARSLDWVGNLDRAVQRALDALDIAPDNADTLAILGEIYTDNGNWDIAQNYLDQALAREPDNVLALRNLAYLYERLGEYEAAIEVYDRALTHAPDRFDLYVEKGRQYRVGLFEYEKAVAAYEQAVEVYEAPITLDALGDGLYNKGDHLQAVRVLRKAVEMDPTYGPAQVHLGMALYARRNYEDAALTLQQGLEIVGDDARIEQIYTLGFAYAYKEPQKCDQAIQWFQKALEIDPTNGPALEGIAFCNR